MREEFFNKERSDGALKVLILQYLPTITVMPSKKTMESLKKT